LISAKIIALKQRQAHMKKEEEASQTRLGDLMPEAVKEVSLKEGKNEEDS